MVFFTATQPSKSRTFLRGNLFLFPEANSTIMSLISYWRWTSIVSRNSGGSTWLCFKKVQQKKNIKKEELFRSERLSQIRETEVWRRSLCQECLDWTIDWKPKRETFWERRARYLELVRINKSNVTIIRLKFDDPVL